MIRPSGTQQNQLVLTWKFDHDVIVHIPIQEHEKPNPQAMARRLTVGTYDFEDLDDLLASLVEPMKIYAEEMYAHRCYVAGSAEDIERRLINDKRQNPARIPYYIGISHEQPGRFVLYYMPNQHPRTESVVVDQQGFRFRSQNFRNIDQLIDWFKRHWNETPQRKAPPRVPPPAVPPVSRPPEAQYRPDYMRLERPPERPPPLPFERQERAPPRRDWPRREQREEDRYDNQPRHSYTDWGQKSEWD